MYSASVLSRTLDEFSLSSGLYPSMTMSTVYFGNVPNDVKCKILMVVPFNEGNLLARYLGVPLVSRKLYKDDCKILIENVRKRINDWRNKCLSYARRLQLITSILSSLQVDQTYIFLLLVNVCDSIDTMLKSFLWAGSDKDIGSTSVSWKDICMPKSQWGLGLKPLQKWNEALMSKHLWNIVSNKKSVWVKWVNLYWLKGNCLWSLDCDMNSSWCWKQFLGLWNNIRKFVRCKLGNGHSCNIWFDQSHDLGPLSKTIDQREIVLANLSLTTKVVDMIRGHNWSWPRQWCSRFNDVLNICTLVLYNDIEDKAVWVNNKGKEKCFSIKEVWKGIRNNSPKVIWYKHVWFS